MMKARHALLVLLVLFLAGCTAAPPSASPVSPAAAASPSPSAKPAAASPSPPATRPPASLPTGAFRLATDDGLALTLAADGRVVGLTVDGAEVVSSPAPALTVRDMSHAADLDAPNLLSNPGFERSGGWQTLTAHNVQISLDAKAARSGGHALAITATGAGGGAVISAPIPVAPGHRYRVSGWFRSQKGYVSHPAGTAVLWQRDLYREFHYVTGLYLWWVDASGRRIGERPDLAVALHEHAESWRRLIREVTAPPGAAAVQVVVAAVPDKGDTLWVDDLALVESPEAERPLGGKVAVENGAVVQRVSLPEAALTFTATYTAYEDYLTVHVQVDNTGGQERALEVAWGVPLDTAGGNWRWWDSIHDPRPITDPVRYAHLVSADMATWMPMSLYPAAALENGARGLALALPLDEPRVAALSYDGASQRLEGRAFLGISPQATRLGPHADFTLYLYRIDPAWGLRSALARLQAFHPEWFDAVFDPDDYADFRQGGFINPAGASMVSRYDKENIYTAQYTCTSLNIHLGPANGPAPTLEEGWQQVEAYASERATSGEAARRKARMQSFLKSVVRDGGGQAVVKAVGVFPWAPDSWEIAWVPNMDPDLEGGYAAYTMQWEIDRAFDAAAQRGATLDGVQIDNFMAAPMVDLRPDHLAVADIPLTYSFNDYRPGVHTMAATAEYLAALREHLDARYGQGKGITVNFWGLGTVNFLSPWIDGFGGEGDVRGDAQNWNREVLDYRRATAGRRVQFFAVQEANLTVADAEAVGNRALFYGIIPFRGHNGLGWEDGAEETLARYAALVRTYNGLGWEPLTYARTDHPDVAVERFGDEVFTLYNWGDAAATYTLRVDLAALGRGAPAAVTESTANAAVEFTVEGQTLVIQDTLAPGQVHVFRLGGS